MAGILSIQSHVAYGYVGNKAAVYPLQAMGYDVWPVHTVQFSNHTGYGHWQGDVFSGQHIQQVVMGMEELGLPAQCDAILSGYLGNEAIGQIIGETVVRWKSKNPDLLYACDPVMGDVGRGIFVKPEIVDFFKKSMLADVVTPNHFEAELLCGFSITTLEDAKTAACLLHEKRIPIVVITSLQVDETPKGQLVVFLSHNGKTKWVETPYFEFPILPNGTGDLFSALFVGFYLRFRDAEQALVHAVNKMHAVVAHTYQKNRRELLVLSGDYGCLPNVVPEVGD